MKIAKTLALAAALSLSFGTAAVYAQATQTDSVELSAAKKKAKKMSKAKKGAATTTGSATPAGAGGSLGTKPGDAPGGPQRAGQTRTPQ